MEQRKEFITAWQRGETAIAELCREYGISRQTAYQWIHRFEDGGETGLHDRSRAPHRIGWGIAEEVAERIVGVREQHPRWGPRKILGYLEAKAPTREWPAPSSIGALLQRQGLVVRRKKRLRVPSHNQPLAHAEQSNRVWCADFKGWFRCGDGTRCDPLTASDAYSRFLLRCQHVAKTDGPHVRGIFEAMFREYGMPDAIRTDNGPPFASKAPAGLSGLAMWWLQLGIRHERIERGCPQQNGRHERMHQTLKQETASPPQADLRRQQEAFRRFEQEYNYERPHEALGNRTPAQMYVASSRAYPSRLPELEYPAGAQLRWVSRKGSVKWKGRRTFLSEVLARQPVGLVEVEDELFEVYYGPVFLGWFDGRYREFQREHEPARHRGRNSLRQQGI